jgi:hypothetical protein
MELKTVKIKDLKTNPLQPENRTTNTNLFSLRKSIKEDGQLTPILIDKNFVICDGHRRVNSLKQLGVESVKAIVYNGEISNLKEIDVWLRTNANTKPITNANFLQAFLKGAEIPANRLKPILWVVEKCGQKFLKELSKRNVSATYPRRFWKTAESIGYSDPERFKRFILWILDNHQTFVLRACEKNTYNKATLKYYIEANLPADLSELFQK